jgi:Ricin-type beta-trefoil lectin domain-like
MTDATKKTTWLAASLALASALAGCQPGIDSDESAPAAENELTSSNGLSMLNGLSMTNGLSGNGLSGNGLSGNGLSGNGLLMDALSSTTAMASSSTLMNSASGRTLVSYIVKCALPVNHSVTKKDSGGTSYTYPGAVGTAPEWETGTCGTTCQERMTACLLAHVNTSGVHIPIWLDSEGAIGWGTSTDYPYQEGSFFGNVFVSPPVAQYCNGKDFDSGTVPGRLGANSNAPYTNPFGSTSLCSSYCTAHSTDGFTQCGNYTHVVTVWRNFDVNTQYKICNKQNTKCLEVAGSSKSASAAIQQRTYSAASNQKWTITQISSKKYKVVNVNSGLALDLNGSSTSDNTALIQSKYSGTATQLWSFQSLGDQLGSYEVSPSGKTASTIWPALGVMTDGAAVQAITYNTNDSQKWYISPL